MEVFLFVFAPRGDHHNVLNCVQIFELIEWLFDVCGSPLEIESRVDANQAFG